MAENETLYMDLEFAEETIKAKVLGLFVPFNNGRVYIALENEAAEETYLYEYVDLGEDGFSLKDIPDHAYDKVEAAFQARMEAREAEAEEAEAEAEATEEA